MEQITSHVASMVDVLKKKREKEAAEALKKDEVQITMAQAFDTHNATLPASIVPRPLPWLVYPMKSGVSDSVGWMAFRELTFEQVAQMMRDYPALPMVKWRDSQRRVTGMTVEGRAKGDTREETDGFKLEIAQGVNYGPMVQIQWETSLGGVIVGVRAELAPSQMRPSISVQTSVVCGEVVAVRGSTAEVHYPFGDTAGLRHVRYQQSGKLDYPHFLIYGVPAGHPGSPNGGMMRYVDSVVAELERRGAESMAAYLKDKESGHLIADLPRAGGMTTSAGSPAQEAALQSDAARRDRGLAEKHWRAYCQDSKPEEWPKKPDLERQGWFDHYAWACKWLQREGLYRDPNFLTKDGKPYAYGTRWINADGTIHGD